MACYQGYDFSESSSNEMFTEVGTNSGQPYYENETTGTFLFYYTGYDTYYIDDVVSNPPTNPVQYYNLTTGTDPAGTYEVSSGPSYAGYVELISCDAPVATTSPTIMTTNDDVVFGIGIIIFVLATIFGSYMNSIFKKNVNAK